MSDSVSTLLHTRLIQEFAPLHLHIRDDSAKHAGHAGAPAGGNSHFTVIIVAAAFDGLSKLARQQAVNAVLKDLFQTTSLHALSLRIFTPAEWLNHNPQG